MRVWIALFCLVGLCSGCLVDSYSEAVVEAEGLKARYGTGVSTLIIIKNDLPHDLVLKKSHSCHGYFYHGQFIYPLLCRNGNVFETTVSEMCLVQEQKYEFS